MVEVIAVGTTAGSIEGVEIHTDRPLFQNVHTITLYVSPKWQSTFYDYIVSLKPSRVLFNPGTENKELMDLLDTHDIQWEIACTLVMLSVDQY